MPSASQTKSQAGNPEPSTSFSHTEIGDAEIGSDQDRVFGFRVVDFVNSRLYLDGLLRVGVDVLAQDKQRIDVFRGERIQHDKPGVLGDGLSRQD